MNHRIIKLAGSGAAAALIAFAGAGAASAAGGPNGSATNPVSLTVASSLTVSSSNINSWQFTGAFADGANVGDVIQSPQTGGGPGDTNVTVTTTDPAGYVLTAAASAPLSAGSNALPETAENLSWYVPAHSTVNAGWQTGDLAAPRQISTSAGPSAGDVYPVALQIQVPATQAPGSYTGQAVVFTGQGN